MTITPIDGQKNAGIAGSFSERIDAQIAELVTGDTPTLFTTDEPVGADADLPMYGVVGFDANGVLALATQDGTVKALGILLIDVATGAGDDDAHTHVYRGGCFNPDILVWDASFDTDSKKKTAFEGAPSPSQIVIRAPRTMTVDAGL